MSDRFSLDWNKVKRQINSLLDILSGNEHLLVESFLAVSRVGEKSKSVDDVRNHLRVILMNPGTPWVLYNMIAHLSKKLPPQMQKTIISTLCFDTGRAYERLQLSSTGIWQVTWQVDQHADPDDQNVALDWYIPPDADKAPIVPTAIIDYVASCVSLLRGDLLLPATSVLLIALESALWHALAARGVSRYSERTTYAPTKWMFRKVSQKLIIEISGSDKNIDDIESTLGIYPAAGNFEARFSGFENSKAIIRMEVDTPLKDFFSSSVEDLKETFPDKGLSEAIQRARKVGLLENIAFQFDDTIIRLRNNLVHLPANGQLEPPVPNITGGYFTTLAELQREPQFIRGLVYLIVELINILFTAK